MDRSTKGRSIWQSRVTRPNSRKPGVCLCARVWGMSRLAQLVERKTLNLVVVGSSPTVGGRRIARAPFCCSWARGIGAIGSVRASQARGTGIETQILHKDAQRGIGAIGSVRP